MIKKKSESIEKWKPYKLRKTVELRRDGDEYVARDSKGKQWVVSKDELRDYKSI